MSERPLKIKRQERQQRWSARPGGNERAGECLSREHVHSLVLGVCCGVGAARAPHDAARTASALAPAATTTIRSAANSSGAAVSTHAINTAAAAAAAGRDVVSRAWSAVGPPAQQACAAASAGVRSVGGIQINRGVACDEGRGTGLAAVGRGAYQAGAACKADHGGWLPGASTTAKCASERAVPGKTVPP